MTPKPYGDINFFFCVSSLSTEYFNRARHQVSIARPDVIKKQMQFQIDILSSKPATFSTPDNRDDTTHLVKSVTYKYNNTISEFEIAQQIDTMAASPLLLCKD